MIFKKSGKTIFGVDLTAAETKAIDREIEKRLAAHTRKHNIEFAAMVLYELRDQLDFGEKRLRRFYDNFDTRLDELMDAYEMGEEDLYWLCTKKLMDAGIDVAKWHDENEAKRKE